MTLETGVGKKDYSDLSAFDPEKLNKKPPSRYADQLREAFAEASVLVET